MNLINKKFKNKEIIFDLTKDGVVYLNATKTAKQFGKEVRMWLRLKETKEYISILREESTDVHQMHNGDFIVVKQGGNDKNSQGTWLHPKLTIFFARWLDLRFSIWCDETVENILKNGFYISKEISDSQVQNLVQESLSIYEERKLFDLELKKLKSVIYGELISQGATQKQIGGMFSNMFQNLHIATTKRTAGQIVFDEMKTQKRDLKIQTFNQLRTYPKEIKGDLLLAINYYSDDELIRFRGYLNSVITDVVQYIQSPHTTVTLSKLQFEIVDSSQRKALKMTGYDIQRFPRPLRKEVAKILDLLLVDGTDSEILETMENIRITYHNLQYK